MKTSLSPMAGGLLVVLSLIVGMGGTFLVAQAVPPPATPAPTQTPALTVVAKAATPVPTATPPPAAPTAATVTATATTVARAATTASATPPTATPAPNRTPTPGATARPGNASRVPPTRISIERIGVSASIVNVGLLADGSMGVPQRAADVAWYQPGPTPGENSNAILAGHYDWYGAQGAFFRLTELRAGDVISITRSDGSQVRFSVRETRWFGANDSPAEVFAPTPIATITLVTCGGVIDRATGTYDKRYVVRAVAL